MMQRYLICICLALTMSGCALRSTTPTTTQAAIPGSQQQLQRIEHWNLSGKLGIRTLEDSGSASLQWVQQLSNYEINLSGPLGQRRTTITGRPGEVQLLQGSNAPLKAQTAEALIEEVAGWTVPVTQLIYWIRGLPDPKQPIDRQQKTLGQLTYLQQGGWKINYSNYKNYAYDAPKNQPLSFALPGRITAENKEVRLTLVIRDWQLGNPAPQ